MVPTYPPVQYAPPPKSSGNLTLSSYDFNGEYIGWPLARVCKETTYIPGLYYVCDNNSGGIGNIRNFILTCIRYAIEAGASGIVMPKIQRRAEDHIENLFTGLQPFGYFFDEKHFRDAMGENCPQIKIYDELKDVPRFEAIVSSTEFYPKELNLGGPGGDGCDERGINRHLDLFRVHHDAWLKDKLRHPVEAAPVSVRFRWATFFEWPIYRDGPEFANTFGDLLRLRKDVQEIAASILDELSNIIHGTTGQPDRKQLDLPYMGIHLRTETDALDFWPKYEFQALGYIEQAGKRGLKHAYIASGDAKEGHKFGELALEHIGMKVYGKTDLLKGDAMKKLNKLSWDQQALVDFLVLTKSSHFAGCSFSSFSMNIAVKRHIMTGGLNTRPWRSPADVYSTLVGRFESWYGDWMFMIDCMWP